MAAYIPVPRDLTRVKSKVFFNLTKRQLICFGAAALIGVPFFFFLKSFGNVSLAALGMIIVMLPLFFLAMYEKDGQPLEVIAHHFMVFHSLLFCIGTNRETPSHKIFSANLTHRRKASVWKMLR